MDEEEFNYPDWFAKRLDVLEKKLDALIFLEHQRADTNLKGPNLWNLLNCYERGDKAGLIESEPLNSDDIEFIGVVKHRPPGHYCYITRNKDENNV